MIWAFLIMQQYNLLDENSAFSMKKEMIWFGVDGRKFE